MTLLRARETVPILVDPYSRPAFSALPAISTPTAPDQWLLSFYGTGSPTGLDLLASTLLIMAFQLPGKTSQPFRSWPTQNSLLSESFPETPYLEGVSSGSLTQEITVCMIHLSSTSMGYLPLFIWKCYLNLLL